MGETPFQVGDALDGYVLRAECPPADTTVAFVAEHYETKELRALRVLRSKIPDREAASLALMHEAAKLSAVTSDHAPDVYEVVDREPFYFVTELVRGRSLVDLLASAARRGTPLAIPTALYIARQVAEVLTLAHEAGTDHLQLTASSVLLTRSGADPLFVKLMDLGAMRRVTPTPQQELNSAKPIMLTGAPGYMAPEQLQQSGTDQRTDIWAFGVLLYELCVGRRPFLGSANEVVRQVLLAPPPDPATILPPGHLLPPALVSIVRRCLEKRAALRPPSMRQLLLALSALAEQFGPPRLYAEDANAPETTWGLHKVNGAYTRAPKLQPGTSVPPGFAVPNSFNAPVTSGAGGGAIALPGNDTPTLRAARTNVPHSNGIGPAPDRPAPASAQNGALRVVNLTPDPTPGVGAIPLPSRRPAPVAARAPSQASFPSAGLAAVPSGVPSADGPVATPGGLPTMPRPPRSSVANSGPMPVPSSTQPASILGGAALSRTKDVDDSAPVVVPIRIDTSSPPAAVLPTARPIEPVVEKPLFDVPIVAPDDNELPRPNTHVWLAAAAVVAMIAGAGVLVSRFKGSSSNEAPVVAAVTPPPSQTAPSEPPREPPPVAQSDPLPVDTKAPVAAPVPTPEPTPVAPVPSAQASAPSPISTPPSPSPPSPSPPSPSPPSQSPPGNEPATTVAASKPVVSPAQVVTKPTSATEPNAAATTSPPESASQNPTLAVSTPAPAQPAKPEAAPDETPKPKAEADPPRDQAPSSAAPPEGDKEKPAAPGAAQKPRTQKPKAAPPTPSEPAKEGDLLNPF